MGGERGAGRPGCKFGMAHVRQLGLDARHVVMRRPVEYRRTLAGVKGRLPISQAGGTIPRLKRRCSTRLHRRRHETDRGPWPQLNRV